MASVLGGLLPAVSPAADAAHAALRGVAAVDLVSGGIDGADPGDAVGEVVPDADASQVAYTTGRRGTPGTDAWVRNLATGSATRAVAGWDGRAPQGRRNAAAGISDDGRHVAVTSDATNLTGPALRRVSVPSGDVGRGVGEDYEGQAVSADGRYVVFASASPYLVPGDANGTRDVFRHDRVLGTTKRVSVRPDGSQSTGDARFPDISADGRYVSFVSTGTDLVPGEVSGDANAFVRDVGDPAGRTVKVSVSIDGGPIYSDIRWAPSISADGRRVAFTSWASNLVPGDENQRSDVFVRDWVAGTTTLASVGGSGARANEDSYAVALSGDGRKVAFESTATNLVPGDDDGAKGVFLRDLDRGTTAHASAARAAGHDWPSYLDGISGDGRHVVFHSADDDLVAGDTNDGFDLFRYDARTGVTDRVSVDDGGRQRPYSDGAAGDISDDGRYVLFTHLASPAADPIHGVFLHDTRERTTTRVDVAPGVTPNATLHLPNPRISGNGSAGVFRSRASNLVAGDAGTASDVFAVALPTLLRGYVRDRDPDADGRLDEPGETTTVPVGGPAVPLGDLGLSADGSQAVFVSPAAGLVAGDTNGCPDVFVHDRDTDHDGVLDEAGRERIVRVSVSDAGGEGTGVDCRGGAVAVSGARMSPSGRYVTFTTRFRGLADGPEGAAVLRHDRDADGDGVFDEAGDVLTTRLAEATGGAGPWPPAPVADTGDVALLTADAMAAGDTDDATDLYVAGAGPPQRRRVPGARPVTALSLAADGRTVAYRAADGHVYAQTDAEAPVDIDGSARTSSAPALSADGGAVAFLTPDALVAPDGDAAPDAYRSTLTGPPVPTLTAALSSRRGTEEVTATPPGASTVRIGQLPADRLPDMGDFGVVVDPEAASGVVGNSPIRNSPIQNSPIQNSPIQNSPIQNSPIQNSPIRNSPIRNSPIRNSPIGDLTAVIAGSPAVRGLPLTQIALRPPHTWRTVLGGSGTLADRLPSTVTLGEVLDHVSRGAKDGPGVLTLHDLDWSASPLAALSPTALLLGKTPVSRLVLADGGRLVPWCDRFREVTGRTCQAAGIGADTTLGRADADLGAVLSRHSVLRRIPLRPNLGALRAAGAPVLGVDLEPLKLDVTRIGDVPVAAAVAVSPTLGARPAPGGATFAQALASRRLSPAATLQHVEAHLKGVSVGEVTGAFPDAVGVGDVVLGYLDRDDYPFERLDLLRSGVQAYDCAAVDVRHELSFAVGGYRQVDATVTMGFPRGTLVRGLAGDDGCPSAAGRAADARARATWLDEEDRVPPEPAVADGPSGPTLTWRLADLTAGEHRLSVLVNPPVLLGPGSVTASVTAGGRTAVARPRLAQVVETADPSPERPAVIDAKSLHLGYIPDPSDVDRYAFRSGKRTAVGVRLSHFQDGDADLVLYGPPPPSSRTGVPEARGWGTPPAPATEARGDVPGTSPLVADEATTADVPTGAADRDVLAASAARGDGVAEAAAAEGADLVQVSAYNGASSEKPYLLRLREQPIEEPASCAPAAGGTDPVLGNGYSVRASAYGEPGTPPRPGGRATLILVDRTRFRATHGTAGAELVAGALERLARETDGVVMPLDAHDEYRRARAHWDADPCSVDAANGVVSAAATVVRDYWSANRSLRNVVLVGSDQQLPMARLPDVTRTGNESHYGHPKLGDPLARAADRSYLLSDDPYVDFDPVRRLGRRLYLPNLGLGRLVDTPEEIAAQVQTYLDSGRVISTVSPVSPAGVTSAGYGFMTDGAAETAAGAAGSVNRSRGADGRAPVDALPVRGRRWTAADLTAQLRRKAQPVGALFAHAEHDRALSEAGYFGARDVIWPAEVADALAPRGLPPTSRLLLTMGCHTGTSVPASVPPSAGGGREGFARAVAGRGRAAMVAVTGYSAGDSTVVGLHERLLALYAEQIGYQQSIGEALAAAKRAYFRDQGRYGDNDEKALATTVLYGLPMYRLGASRVPPPQERVTPGLAPGASNPVLDLSLKPSFAPQTSDRGTYWTSEDGALAVADRPLQPRLSREVTAEVRGPGGERRLLAAHGVLVTRLADARTREVDAVFARPVTGPAGGGAERVSTGTVFPELPARLTTYDDPGGPAGPDRIGIRQHLVVTPGQFVGDSRPEAAGRGTQVLYGDVGVRVLYASQAAADDWTVPAVGAPSGRLGRTPAGAPQATFAVPAADARGIQRVLVLYRRAGEASFAPLDLSRTSGTPTGGVWSGTAALPAGTTGFEYLVQVVDGAGNVAALSGKGAGIPDRPAPAVVPAAAMQDHLHVTEGTPSGTPSGTTPLEVPVTLDRPAPADLTIPVTLVPGTARAGDDYRATSAAVTVRRGELMGTVTVPVVADGVVEPTEDFRVRLGDAPGVRVVTRESRVVVLDDDGTAADVAYGRVKYSPTEPDPVRESENSAGSVNTVRRLAAGRYDVWFRDVQGPWARGDFHNDGAPYVVTHETDGAAVHCQSNSHGAPYADPEGHLAQRVGVRCFDAAGRDADGRFTVTYLRGGTASGGAGGYVYSEQKGNPRSMPPVMHQFNSAFDPQERSTVVQRTAPGTYVVTMPRLGGAGLRARVMGMGEEPRRCTSPPEGGTTGTGDLQVHVTCTDFQGTPVDTVFALHVER